MASVLGLPRFKGNSDKIIACSLQKGFKPLAGQAVSAVGGAIQSLVIPFNGDFFGIICEIRENPERCTVNRGGLSIAVRKDNGLDIPPKDLTYFNIVNGFLTDNDGVPVNGRIVQLSERVYNPFTGELLDDEGALIDLNQASTLSSYDPQPDFNQADFNQADFA